MEGGLHVPKPCGITGLSTLHSGRGYECNAQNDSIVIESESAGQVVDDAVISLFSPPNYVM